jgi:hypothetical protein
MGLQHHEAAAEFAARAWNDGGAFQERLVGKLLRTRRHYGDTAAPGDPKWVVPVRTSKRVPNPSPFTLMRRPLRSWLAQHKGRKR